MGCEFRALQFLKASGVAQIATPLAADTARRVAIYEFVDGHPLDAADIGEAELDQANKQLAAAEADMASGDLYSWAINNIRQFKQPYKVEMPQFSTIDGPKDFFMLPSFPYKQATLTVAGVLVSETLARALFYRSAETLLP